MWTKIKSGLGSTIINPPSLRSNPWSVCPEMHRNCSTNQSQEMGGIQWSMAKSWWGWGRPIMNWPTKFELNLVNYVSANAQKLLDQSDTRNSVELEQKLIRLWMTVMSWPIRFDLKLISTYFVRKCTKIVQQIIEAWGLSQYKDVVLLVQCKPDISRSCISRNRIYRGRMLDPIFWPPIPLISRTWRPRVRFFAK